jgi:hypothetical protein
VLHRAKRTITGFCGVEIETRRCGQSAGSSRTELVPVNTFFPPLPLSELLFPIDIEGVKTKYGDDEPERVEHCRRGS